jgi:hypothetical protein
VLLIMMLGGTLPVPLYVLYENQMDFGPLGVTVVFPAYVLCALALAAVAVIPETVRRRDRRISVRPRMAVPSGLGAVMLGACLGVFAAFSVLGLFSSLVPTFLHGVLGVHNLALHSSRSSWPN